MTGVIAWAAGLYVVVVLFLFLSQRSLLYFPDPNVPEPDEYGVPEMAIERIKTTDGFRLLAWWRPPVSPERPVLVYFHGNAGHLGHRAAKIRPYLDSGYGVLLVSYRYNAGAGGRPSESALYADARAAADFVAAQGIPEDRVVLYGESLGSAPAVRIAVERRVGAVVLEAPFTSIAEVAQSHYWYVPARWMVWDKFDIAAIVDRLKAPLLVLHGERDRIVPLRFGRAVLERAPEPKEGRFLPEAGHNDLYEHGAAQMVIEFLERRLGQESGSGRVPSS